MDGAKVGVTFLFPRNALLVAVAASIWSMGRALGLVP